MESVCLFVCVKVFIMMSVTFLVWREQRGLLTTNLSVNTHYNFAQARPMQCFERSPSSSVYLFVISQSAYLNAIALRLHDKLLVAYFDAKASLNVKS